MTQHAANDFASIAMRMRELRGEPIPTAEPTCRTCEGGGWECYGLGIGDPHFRTCPACGNPEGHPSP